MRAPIPAFLLAAVLLAGCGGGSIGSKPAAQVLADSQKAATSAKSLRVSGRIETGVSYTTAPSTGIGFDISIEAGKGATGTMSLSGLKFKLIQIGTKVYIKGSKAFLQRFTGGLGSLFEGKWLEASATTGKFASFAALTNPKSLFGMLSRHGKLDDKGPVTYNGERAIEIVDTSDGSRIYIAATGTPYPLAVTGPPKHAGSVRFSDWNKPVSLRRPKATAVLAGSGG